MVFSKSPIVAVVGGAVCSPREAAAAEAIGNGLAAEGVTIICGGGGGVMTAACRGAKAAGGMTIGVLPGFSPKDANPYVDVPIVTGMGEARNVIIVRTARAVIAVGGEFGTLSEIALALKLGRPVIGLNTWELSRHGRLDSSILVAEDAGSAVCLALEAIR